jgi:hypothetical protein
MILDSENITFYAVPLVCGAAPSIGCGSRSKPALLEFEKSPAVQEAWLNRSGKVIAIVWKERPQTETVAKSIFEDNGIQFSELTREQIIPYEKTFRENNLWYRGIDVDMLSHEEAITIAESSVNPIYLNKLLTHTESENLKADIASYFKIELVKIRTKEQLKNDGEFKFKQALYEIAETYVGKEQAQNLIDLKAINGIVNSAEKNGIIKKAQTNNGTFMNDPIILESIITCPACGYQKEETMPTDACQYFYKCEKCETVLKPLAGDCCVFCSYGTVKCPPVQENTSCCKT